MKHIKLFEEFLAEMKVYKMGVVLNDPPHLYAPEEYWKKQGKLYSNIYKDGTKNYSVIQSIAYDLGLKFSDNSKAQTVLNLSNHGEHIKDGDMFTVVVEDAFSSKYTYDELKKAVEDWVKKHDVV